MAYLCSVFSKISVTKRHHIVFLGKDLSSRSKTDLDCIFGKRQSKKTPEVLSHAYLIIYVCFHSLIFSCMWNCSV